MYLFDTNAISEIFRRRPNPEYVGWLAELPAHHHLTSVVVMGELYAAARRPGTGPHWQRRIDEAILPTFTVLPYDLRTAERFGAIRAELAARGRPIGTADLQIAATARLHGLTVVTANHRHFDRVDGLEVHGFEPGLPAGAG